LVQRFAVNFKGNFKVKGKVKGKVNFKGSKRHTMELHHCGRYQAVLVWVGGLSSPLFRQVAKEAGLVVITWTTFRHFRSLETLFSHNA